jgi:hypothetical protein
MRREIAVKHRAVGVREAFPSMPTGYHEGKRRKRFLTNRRYFPEFKGKKRNGSKGWREINK